MRNFLTTAVAVLVLANAQEAPNADLSTPIFNTTQVFRQDLCERYLQVESGEIDLADALSGLPISTIFESTDDNFVMTDGVIDETYPGLVSRLLDDICKRAGCTWRDSYTLLDGALEEGRSFTELLDWMTSTYDLAADTYSSRTERMRLGIAFPEPWFDSSIILVGKKTEEESVFNLLAWTEPFSWDVWVLCIITIFISGFVYNQMNLIDKNKEKFPANNDDATFLAALAFTGKILFKPSQHGARMYTIAIAFWATIIGSAYTANLASALVNKAQTGIVVNSVDDAVRYGLRMCTFDGSNQQRTVLAAYPQAKLVPVTSSSDLYMGVHNGVCDYALTGTSYWDIEKYQADSNPGCQLEWVGRAFENILSGFATRTDTGVRCTSLLRDVFSLHIREMKQDGVFKEYWDEFYRRTGTGTCDPETQLTTDEDKTASRQLTLKNLGGVFVLYYGMVLVAIGLAIFSNKKKQREAVKDLPSVPGVDIPAESAPKKDVETPANPSSDGGLDDLRFEMNEKFSQILMHLSAPSPSSSSFPKQD